MAPNQAQSKSIPLKKLKKGVNRSSHHARKNHQVSGPHTPATPAAPANTLASQSPDPESTVYNPEASSSAAPNASRTPTTNHPQPLVLIRRLRSFRWIAKPIFIVTVAEVVVTVAGVVASIIFGLDLKTRFQEQTKWDKWFANDRFIGLCRNNRASKNGTTPEYEGVLNESPQPPPERRYILKRSFVSSIDWEQVLASAGRILLLAEYGLFVLFTHDRLCFGRWLDRKHLKWEAQATWNDDDDLPRSNSRPGQYVFVSAKFDHQSYHFIKFGVTDLKFGATFLSKVAESFRIGSRYEASRRLDNPIFVKFRSLSKVALANSGPSFPGEVTGMNCLPPPEQLMNKCYKMEDISSRKNPLPLLLRSLSGSFSSSLAPLVSHRLPLCIVNHGRPRNGDHEEWGIILSRKNDH